MAARSLEERLEILEQTVGELRLLPARMDALESQILQLRGEMREGFSAIHTRLAGHGKQFETIEQRFETFEQRFERVDQQFARVEQRFERVDQQFAKVEQRFERVDQQFERVDQRFDEMSRHMRVLHEEVLHRFSLLQEGRPRRKR